MKMQSSNDPVVLTLNDDISNQLLESNDEDKTGAGHSSVELWIKSLKDPKEFTDDSRLDQDNNDSISSDLDELQLGAEAINLRRKNRSAFISGGSPRDSDSEDNRYFTKKSKRFVLRRQASEQTSLDSDTSGLSSITSCSVSSLLTARESDPEQVLKCLGFGGPDILDNIPNRFISAGTRCEGVNVEQFLHNTLQGSVDPSCATCYQPPWIMARVDDIPDQFFRSSSSECPPTQESTHSFLVPVLKEPTSAPDGIKEQPGKVNHTRPKPLPFPSKFGTFLEPVSEEVELSSQGSITLSPVVMKTLSFESNRSSTLNSNNQEESPENITKIPSLKDLWESQPSEGEAECSSWEHSENFVTLTDAVGEYSSEETEKAQKQDELSEASNRLWAIPEICESIPAVVDFLGGEEIIVSEDNLAPVDTDSVKSDKQLFEEVDSDSLSSELGKQDKEVVRACSNESWETIRESSDEQVRSSENITPVKVSKLDKPTRKISTVTLPSWKKLLPVVRNNSSPGFLQSSAANSTHLERITRRNLGKQVDDCKERRKNTLQLNLYDEWVVVERTGQRQIYTSNKEHLKNSENSFFRNHREADAKVMIKNCCLPSQVVIPEVNSPDIECFSNVESGSVSTSEVVRPSSSASSRSYSEDSSGIVSLSTLSEYSTTEHQLGPKINVHVSHQKPFENDLVVKLKGQIDSQRKAEKSELPFNYCRENDIKADSTNSLNDWGNYDQKFFKNGKSIKEELDGLRSSLKEIKQYKAGIHLMQLATSVESVSSSEQQLGGCTVHTCQKVLGSIQNELRHLEEYILNLQKQLTSHRKKKVENVQEEKVSEESNFSEITRQLLREQLKMFNLMSASVSQSPSTTPSTHFSYEEPFPTFTEDSVLRGDPTFTEDSVLRSDINELRKEVRLLRQENTDRHSVVKAEILSEIRTEIRNCFREFLESLEGNP